MEQTKNRLFLLVPLCFAVLTLSCWLRSPKSESLAERRKLAQMPAFSVKALESGRFSSDFERYSQDQFPLRESFRSLKALFSTKILGRSDNNRIFSSQGYCAELNYPADLPSARHAASREGIQHGPNFCALSCPFLRTNRLSRFISIACRLSPSVITSAQSLTQPPRSTLSSQISSPQTIACPPL